MIIKTITYKSVEDDWGQPLLHYGFKLIYSGVAEEDARHGSSHRHGYNLVFGVACFLRRGLRVVSRNRQIGALAGIVDFW